MGTRRRKRTKSCKYGKLKRPVRTKSGKKRRCKKSKKKSKRGKKKSKKKKSMRKRKYKMSSEDIKEGMREYGRTKGGLLEQLQYETDPDSINIIEGQIQVIDEQLTKWLQELQRRKQRKIQKKLDREERDRNKGLTFLQKLVLGLGGLSVLGAGMYAGSNINSQSDNYSDVNTWTRHPYVMDEYVNPMGATPAWNYNYEGEIMNPQNVKWEYTGL